MSYPLDSIVSHRYGVVARYDFWLHLEGASYLSILLEENERRIHLGVGPLYVIQSALKVPRCVDEVFANHLNQHIVLVRCVEVGA